MAGFPDGFEHTFLAIAGFAEEVQQAIAGYWEEIGIKTEIQVVDYRGVFRPTVVDRSNFSVYAQGCRHHNGLPFDWPRGPQNTSLTRGGFGAPRILRHLSMDAIRDVRKAVVGYSDVTSLLLFFQRACDLVVFHGPNIVTARMLEYPEKTGSQISLHDHLFHSKFRPISGLTCLRGAEAQGCRLDTEEAA